MKSIQESGNKAFLNGKQLEGSTRTVSCPPLFIGARGKEDKTKIRWKTRRHCLLHGEFFRWKNRCRHCGHLITFQVRLN